MLHVPVLAHIILDLIYRHTTDVNDNYAVTTVGGNGEKIKYKLDLQPQWLKSDQEENPALPASVDSRLSRWMIVTPDAAAAVARLMSRLAITIVKVEVGPIGNK